MKTRSNWPIRVEGQRGDLFLEYTRLRYAGCGDLDHPKALVKRHHVAAQMLGEEAHHSTLRTRAGGKARTTPMSCSTSADQPGRSRSANDPVPSHQSSYSAARWSKCARISSSASRSIISASLRRRTRGDR